MARVYVKDPSKAPAGAKLTQGKRGGFYYESGPKQPKATSSYSEQVSHFTKEVPINSEVEYNYDYFGDHVIRTKGESDRVESLITPEHFSKDHVSIHNHTDNTPPSPQDIMAFLYMKQSASIITNPDGTVYVMTKDENTTDLDLGIVPKDKEELRDLVGYVSERSEEEMRDFVVNVSDQTVPFSVQVLPYFQKKYNFKVDVINKTAKKYIKKAGITNQIDSIIGVRKDPKKVILLLNSFFKTTLKAFISTKLFEVFTKSKRSIIPSAKITRNDDNIVESVLNSKVLSNTYSYLSKRTSKKINDIIAQGVKQGIGQQKIRAAVSNEIKTFTNNRVETIVRTESNNIMNLAREKAYSEIDPEQKRKYIMRGPTDSRNAESSRVIKREQGRGLPMKDLKKLVKRVAMKYHPTTYDPSRPFSYHINQRHSLGVAI